MSNTIMFVVILATYRNPLCLTGVCCGLQQEFSVSCRSFFLWFITGVILCLTGVFVSYRSLLLCLTGVLRVVSPRRETVGAASFSATSEVQADSVFHQHYTGRSQVMTYLPSV